MLSGVFIAEEVYGVGDKGPGDTTTAEVQTVLETFERVPASCLFH